MMIKAWMDNQEIVEVLKALSNDVERLKKQVVFYAARMDAQAKMIAEIKYKGQVD